MKKYWKLWSGIVAVIFLLASCAPSAHIEKDDNTDFSQYKTFAWVDKGGTENKSKSSPMTLTEQKVKAAVTQELQKTAGWKETKRNPDVLLSYDVLVERTTKQQSDPVYSRSFVRTFYNPYSRRFFNVYYPSRFMGYDSYNVPAREGTISISMIDAETDKTVWQGWTTSELDGRNISGKEIQSGVKAIFRKFDVAKN